ncbi:hypothetical protein [Actinopolymorpha pittospori]
MDMWGALRVLARRWLVVVPLLVLTALGAAGLYTATGPEYTVTGSMLVLGPNAGQDEATGKRNPYLDYGNLAVAAKVVIDVTLTPTTYESLTRATQTTFELGLDTTTSAPLIGLSVVGPSPDAVLKSAQTVIDFVNTTLRQRQLDAGAPEVTLISTEIVTPPVDVLELNSSRLRLVIAIAGVGVLMSVGGAFLVEAIVRVRARSRRPLRLEADEAPTDTSPAVSPAPPSEGTRSHESVVREADLPTGLELRSQLSRGPLADTQPGSATGNGHDRAASAGKRARRFPDPRHR